MTSDPNQASLLLVSELNVAVHIKGDDYSTLENGQYGRLEHKGTWFCKTPDGHYGNLAHHDITEHEDGTITVSPSIEISTSDRYRKKIVLFHGYLEHGQWRSA